jgi:hypothetical protein
MSAKPPKPPSGLYCGGYIDGLVRWLSASLSSGRRGIDTPGQGWASCTLPTGEVIEVTHRVPLYTLARKLEALGYGDWFLQAFASATGTRSLRGKVSVMAGLTVEESDKRGLRLRKFKPFPVGGPAKERDLGPEGTQPPEKAETRLSESRRGGKAA